MIRLQLQTMNIIDWLTNELNDRDLTNADFARRSGLSKSIISLVMSGQRRASADFCITAARTLHIDPLYVLGVGGHLPPSREEKRQADPILDELITIYTNLTPHLKEAALLMLRGLHGPPVYINPTAPRLSLDLTQDADNTPQTETTEEMEKGSGRGGQQSKDNMARQAYSRFFDNYPLKEVEQVSQHLIALLQEAIEKQRAIDQGERSGA